MASQKMTFDPIIFMTKYVKTVIWIGRILHHYHYHHHNESHPRQGLERVGKKADKYLHHEEVMIENSPSARVSPAIWSLKSLQKKNKQKVENTEHTNTTPSTKRKLTKQQADIKTKKKKMRMRLTYTNLVSLNYSYLQLSSPRDVTHLNPS